MVAILAVCQRGLPCTPTTDAHKTGSTSQFATTYHGLNLSNHRAKIMQPWIRGALPCERLSTHVVLVMIRVLFVQRMIGAVGMFLLAALVVMTMMVMAVLTVRVFVAVMPLAVMHIRGCIRVNGGRWSRWRAT